MALPLAGLAIAGLVIFGITAALELDVVLAWTARPLILACMLLGIAYTGVAIRLGWIATMDHVGRVHHFERVAEPFWFWKLVGMYLVMAVPTAWYMIASIAGQG